MVPHGARPLPRFVSASSPAPHGLEVALWRAPLRELAFPENPIKVARVDLGSGMADDVGEGFRGEVAAREADATRAFPARGKEIEGEAGLALDPVFPDYAGEGEQSGGEKKPVPISPTESMATSAKVASLRRPT